jgi:NTE family protein/lysophospholipid hydrolase
MLEDILKLREKSLILSEFDEQSLREFLPFLKEVRVAPGTELVREGEKADSAYFVLEGNLQVLARSQGSPDAVINEMGPGDTLGEVTLFCGGQRTATVRSLTESRLARLPLAEFGRLLDARPKLSRKLMESATRRLRRSQLAERVEQIFGPLDRKVVTDLEAEMEWISLKGGDALFHQGRAAQSAYIVIEGRLRVIAEDPSGKERVLDEVGPGETVGEIALITEGTRAASVFAVRDSEAVRFSRGSFEKLAHKYPKVMMHVSRLLGSRLLKMGPASDGQENIHTTITVVPVGENIFFQDLLHRLVESVSRLGPTLHLSSSRIALALENDNIAGIGEDHPAALRLKHWLSEQEAAHEFVIYEPDTEWSAWSQRCLRQGDHLLFVARSDSATGVSGLEKQFLEKMPPRAAPRTSLVLLHPEGLDEPRGTAKWLSERTVDHHYHVRHGRAGDHDRLARILTGNATGLVLGGGGARGFAHIGLLRAFEELGIPIDFVGGTSQGSIIGGGCGMGLNSREIHEKCRNLFTGVFDFTLPLVSFIAGRKIYRKMLAAFGDRQIEDLPTTFFCISTNLTQARQAIHRSGSLLKAVRGSISLPGIMPPVCQDGDLLVDGGLLNNVPIDVMRSVCGRGKVIAVDVAPSVGAGEAQDFSSQISGWKVFLQKINPFGRKKLPPSIISTIVMSVFVGGINTKLKRKKAGVADLYLEIPVGRWGIMDFDSLEEIVEMGYQYSLARMRDTDFPEHKRISARPAGEE